MASDTSTQIEIKAEVSGIEKVDSLEKSVSNLSRQTDVSAREEERLAAIVEASKTRQKMAAQELLAAEKKAYAEAEQASARAATQRAKEAAEVEAFSRRTKQALSDAFSAVGIRGSGEIQAEILKIQQSLLKLGANAKVSGADFDRAFAESKIRIAALEAEMSGAVPAVEKMGASARSLRGEFVTLGAQFAGLVTAIQAGQAFIHANSQVESLTRSLTLLTGSSTQAAAEMEYVRGAAQRLGVDVLDTSRAYVQLIAATKGTALEGQGARQVFESVAGAMATLGKSSADTNSALLAINQMASKGTASLEELKGQLSEHLPGAMKAAANGAGLTVTELTKMVESGGVLAEDLLPALAKGLTEMYGVGKANNDTFVANWARMKNAVTETMTVIGDSGVFMALSQALGGAASALGVFTVGLEASAKKVGVMAAAIASGDFGLSGFSDRAKQALGEIDAQTERSLKKISDAGAGAKDALGATGQAAADAGKKAAESEVGWLKIAHAYSEVEQASEKQVAKLKTLLDAHDAGAAAMKAFADTFGTQAEKLDAAANAAKEHEAATRALSDQVRADLELSKAKLISLEQERGADGKLTEEKEKLREALQKTITAKEAEAEKTTQATAAAHAATLQAQAATSVFADHAKQVYALRDAWQAAETEYQRLAALNAQGVNVAQELKAADEARAKALLLYRDALADATAAAERHVTAERAAAGLQQSALQNDLYRANTILEVAKQRGNEKEIAQAQIAVWRIELEISEAQAAAARLEAEAMLLVAKAKRAELEAAGELTEAKKAELAVMDVNIRAKQLEAEKFDLVADRMKKLAYETKELQSSMFDLSESTDRIASSADKAAASYDGLAGSIRSAGAAKDGLARDASGNVIEMVKVTQETVTERFKSLGVGGNAASMAARRFFDGNGNVQNTYGRTLEEAIQEEAARINGSEAKQASTPVVQTVKAIRIDITNAGKKSSATVLGEESVAVIIDALRKGASAEG